MNRTFYKSALLQLFMLLFFSSVYAQTLNVEIVKHMKRYSIVKFVKNDNGLNVPITSDLDAGLRWIGIDLPCMTQLSVHIVTANKRYPVRWFVKQKEFDAYELKAYNRNDTVKFYGYENLLTRWAKRNDNQYFLIGIHRKKLKAIDITYN